MATADLPTLMHVAKEEASPVSCDAAVGSLTGSSAPCGGGGEGGENGPEQNPWGHGGGSARFWGGIRATDRS